MQSTIIRVATMVTILVVMHVRETAGSDFSRSGWEFDDLCCRRDLPCVIEIDNTRRGAYGEESPKAIQIPKGKTLSETMSTIMQRYPYHRWSYNHGVLKVLPTGHIPNNPLDAPLGPIAFSKKKFSEISFIINSRARIYSLDEPLPQNNAEDSEMFDFNSASATPRSLWTELVTRAGHAAWIARHHEQWDVEGGTSVYRGRGTFAEVISYRTRDCH